MRRLSIWKIRDPGFSAVSFGLLGMTPRAIGFVAVDGKVRKKIK